jgi:apolipoprotein N-acyltransferase
MRRFPFLELLAAGGVSALALPPAAQWWGQWWLLALTLPVLLLRLEAVADGQWRAGFSAGFAFGLGYFIVALHWIGFAFFVDAKATAWMMPIALGGLAGFMALYWGSAAALSVAVPAGRLPRYGVLAASLSVMEWLRGHLLTGFPWGAPGLVAEGMGGVAQVASVIGMPGLTLLVLLWGLAPSVLWRGRKAGWLSLVLPLVTFALLPVALVWGNWRLAEHATEFRADVRLRLVQPNIEQSEKWRTDNSVAIFETLLSMSGAESDSASGSGTGSGTGFGEDPGNLVIWPESALPFLLDEEPEALARIGETLGPGRKLLTGAIRRSAAASAEQDYFTSVLLVDGMGSVRGSYDKWRLVPGGEFLPFEPLLAWAGFRKVVSLPESFTAGPGPANIAVPGAGNVGVLICYEAIFPSGLVSQTRPDWLLNVTNDGWFHGSVGPAQHLAQMRLRAIEQGLAVARAANTGISAIIDPVGRITQRSAEGVATVVAGALPQSLAATPYGRFGDGALLLLLICLAIGLRLSAPRRGFSIHSN